MNSEKNHHVWWLSLQNVVKPNTKATPLEALALLEQMPRRTLTPRRDAKLKLVVFRAGDFSVKWWTIMNNYLEHWHLYRDMICYCYKMMNTDLENWHLTSKHGNKNREFQRQQLGLNQEIIDNTDMDSSVKQGGFHQFIGIWWDILGMCKLGVSSPGNTPEIPRCERTGQVYHSTWVCQWGTPPKK